MSRDVVNLSLIQPKNSCAALWAEGVIKGERREEEASDKTAALWVCARVVFFLFARETTRFTERPGRLGKMSRADGSQLSTAYGSRAKAGMVVKTRLT